jgi:hypothetical protein
MSSTDRSQARATKKKSKEQEMLKRAKDKAAARHAALLEQQAAAAKARGVTVGAKVKHTNKPPIKLSTEQVKLGKTRTGWHDGAKKRPLFFLSSFP